MADDRDPGLGVFVVTAAAAAGLLAVIFVRHHDRETHPSRPEPPTTEPTEAPSASTSALPPPLASIAPAAPGARAKAARTVVRAVDDGKPLAGAAVVFQTWDGAILAVEHTDAKGEAASDVIAGDMVTVGNGGEHGTLVTVTHLVPGEDVVIGAAEPRSGQREVASARVTLPGPFIGADAGKLTHTVTVGGAPQTLADASEAVVVPVLAGQLDKHGAFEVLGEATTATGEPIAFAVGDGRVAHPDGGAHETIDVHIKKWSRAWQPVEIALANVPQGAVSAELRLEIVHGPAARFLSPPVKIDLGASRASHAKLERPRDVVGEGRLTVDVAFDRDPNGPRARVTRRIDVRKAETTIDLGAELLPRASGIALETSADPARPVVKWTPPAHDARADLALVRLSAASTEGARWMIVTPADAPGSIPLPALPEELADYRPGTAPMRIGVSIVDASFYDGYSDVRKHGAGALEHPAEHEGRSGFVRVSSDGPAAL